jgi:hypothetical protein
LKGRPQRAAEETQRAAEMNWKRKLCGSPFLSVALCGPLTAEKSLEKQKEICRDGTK